jgi:hypothetical protein
MSYIDAIEYYIALKGGNAVISNRNESGEHYAK